MTEESKKTFWRNLWDFLKKSYNLLVMTVLMVSISCSLMLGMYLMRTWTDEIDKKLTAYEALYTPNVDREASRSVDDLKVILSEEASSSEVLEALRDIKSIDNGFYLDFYTNKNLNILQVLNNGEEISMTFTEESFYYYSGYFSTLRWAMIVYVVLIAISPLIVNLFKLMIAKKKKIKTI